MSIEIELKLRILQQKAMVVEQYLQQSTAKMAGIHHYVTTYFDTPQYSLHHLLYSLRIREENGQFTQTLKKSKLAKKDVQQRREWEWSLSEHRLDFTLIEPLALEDVANIQDVIPVFMTEFKRTNWIFSLANHTEVMCSLDQGSIQAGQQSEPIQEIELELLQGNVDALADLSTRLINALPLAIDPRSKAERGFHLLGRGNR